LIGYPGTTLSGGMRVADAAGGSTVVTLYQPERLQIRVDVRFEDIPNVTLGQPVEIENPALRAPLAGTVLFVSSEADIQKNTLQVKVAIDAPPPVFKPEMLVDATFLAPSRPEEPAAPLEELKLYVPKALVHRDDEGAFVWLADQSAGVVRRRPVETDSAAPEGFVEILRGLDASSRLVAGGHDELSDGDRIRITGEQPPVASDRRSAGAIHPSTGAAIQGENH
jgi:multidrug efflux pump subunit AcrA (membrane-fusion protein)